MMKMNIPIKMFRFLKNCLPLTKVPAKPNNLQFSKGIKEAYHQEDELYIL